MYRLAAVLGSTVLLGAVAAPAQAAPPKQIVKQAFPVKTGQWGAKGKGTARCPEDSSVVGGGFDSGHLRLFAWTSRPTDDGKGWTVRVSARGEWSSSTRTATVYAVCEFE
ncbi:hypothetical protein SSP35_28_00320 [Streptomyces sp. NBRC 110611]|nr:hypothetical protein SSP35_28_00320 [Streptomyces sp. NBRC 110611]